MEPNFFMSLVDEIKNCGSGQSCNIILSDDSTYEVGRADCWIGGEDDGWMCDLLGNVCYSTAESLAHALVKYVENELHLEITDIDY